MCLLSHFPLMLFQTGSLKTSEYWNVFLWFSFPSLSFFPSYFSSLSAGLLALVLVHCAWVCVEPTCHWCWCDMSDSKLKPWCTFSTTQAHRDAHAQTHSDHNKYTHKHTRYSSGEWVSEWVKGVMKGYCTDRWIGNVDFVLVECQCHHFLQPTVLRQIRREGKRREDRRGRRKEWIRETKFSSWQLMDGL